MVKPAILIIGFNRPKMLMDRLASVTPLVSEDVDIYVSIDGPRLANPNDDESIANILHQIEDSLGRNRELPKFSSRIIDLDLVLYDDLIDEKLNIPRKDILKYAFVLAPLFELNPEGIHPEKKVLYSSLWKDFQSNQDFVLHKYNIDKLYN